MYVIIYIVYEINLKGSLNSQKLWIIFLHTKELEQSGDLDMDPASSCFWYMIIVSLKK